MSGMRKLKAIACSAAVLLSASAPLLSADSPAQLPSGAYKHGLLLSIDGLHALDVAN
jgi:hypothetical protein